MTTTSAPTLFDLSPPKPNLSPCHYCHEPIAEKDGVPHTCERSLICSHCCQKCHGAALIRMMTGQSPIPWPTKPAARNRRPQPRRSGLLTTTPKENASS